MRARQMRSLVACAVLACGVLTGAGSAVAAHPVAQSPVSVGGAVSAPVTYSRTDLQALPQSTFQTTRRTFFGPMPAHTDEGVSLQSLVSLAQPVLPVGPRNTLLRVTVTVAGRFGDSVTVALGELDPNFGNHPAYLALRRDGAAIPLGPRLVIPGDGTDARSVYRVRRITVGVQSPPTAAPAKPGDVSITDGRRTTVLSANQLAALAAQTRTVTFLAGPTPQTRTERGPTLTTVLTRARFRITRDTWVAAVAASDGYTAVVTPGEALFGGRPLLLSLAEDGVSLTQPRLVADGDVRGGRYVTGVTSLFVGEGT